MIGYLDIWIPGYLDTWIPGGVVKDFGVVKLLNNPFPKSNNPKTGLLRLALDFGHPNPEIL